MTISWSNPSICSWKCPGLLRPENIYKKTASCTNGDLRALTEIYRLLRSRRSCLRIYGILKPELIKQETTADWHRNYMWLLYWAGKRASCNSGVCANPGPWAGTSELFCDRAVASWRLANATIWSARLSQSGLAPLATLAVGGHRRSQQHCAWCTPVGSDQSIPLVIKKIGSGKARRSTWANWVCWRHGQGRMGPCPCVTGCLCTMGRSLRFLVCCNSLCSCSTTRNSSSVIGRAVAMRWRRHPVLMYLRWWMTWLRPWYTFRQDLQVLEAQYLWTTLRSACFL